MARKQVPVLRLIAIALVSVGTFSACDTGAPEVRAGSSTAPAMNDGPFVAYHEDGTRKAEGAFQGGLQSGPWTQWYTSGTRGSQGTWLRGEKTGAWTYWHDGGAKLAEGIYRGERTGPWTFWHADGALQAEGSFLFGEKEGVWVHRHPDGSIDGGLTGVYEADAKIGEMMIDGVTTEWFTDDQPRYRTRYLDGLRHGPASAWYADGGKRYEGQYERGRKTGRWSYWDEEGEMVPDQSGVYDGWQKVGE